MSRIYRIGEFATRTGVSIRTLHHYDAIGLLPPAGYSEGGHRLFVERDLLRLQQILTLRYLGFPLKQIRALLDRPDFDLVASLHVQRLALQDRISEIKRIEAVLDQLLERRSATGRWEWELVATASAAVQDSLAHRSDAMERMKDLYTPEQLKQFEEVGQQTGQQEIREIEEGWTALLAEVRAHRDIDPASPEARALADRWTVLSERVANAYREYPELWQAIGENIRQGRFEDNPQAPTAEDFALIERINQAR
jgi:DNA-binding transcriptional MerR regulator